MMNISKMMACAAIASFMPSVVLAVTIDGPSGRIVSVVSDVPLFKTVNGGCSTPDCTIDGNKSSGSSGFVDWDHAGTLPATFSYTLDTKYVITEFELWNDRGAIDSGIEDFTLEFFDGATSIGTFDGTASLPLSTSSTPHDQHFGVGSFSNVDRIDLIVLTSLSLAATQFREVEFTGTVVPEPSTFALAAFGLFGIGWRRRKRI